MTDLVTDLMRTATNGPPAAAEHPCPEKGCDRVFTTASGLGIHRARTHKPAKAKRRQAPKPVQPPVFDTDGALAFVSPGRPPAAQLPALTAWLDEGERLHRLCTGGS